MSALRSENSWQVRAACRGPQARMFFPPTVPERKDEKVARERQAKAICGTCPVQRPCLEYALDIKEPHGIWGGRSENERRNILAQRGD